MSEARDRAERIVNGLTQKPGRKGHSIATRKIMAVDHILQLAREESFVARKEELEEAAGLAESLHPESIDTWGSEIAQAIRNLETENGNG